MSSASRIGAFASSLFSLSFCVNRFIGPPSLVAWRVQFVESVRKKEGEREREREREGENESIHGKYEVSVLNQFLHTVNFV